MAPHGNSAQLPTFHTLIARAQVQRTRGVCTKCGVEFDDDDVFHICPCLASYRGGIAGAKMPARRSAAVRTRVATGEHGRIRPAQVLTARPACTLSVPESPGFPSSESRDGVNMDTLDTCYLDAKRFSSGSALASECVSEVRAREGYAGLDQSRVTDERPANPEQGVWSRTETIAA